MPTARLLDTGAVTTTLPALVRGGVLDADTAALLWLLVEDRVPLVVAGPADGAVRRTVAEAVLGSDDRLGSILLDLETRPLDVEALGALMRAELRIGLTLPSGGLGDLIDSLAAPPHGLPADAIRRLGVVLTVEPATPGVRVTAAHYLRPSERDGQGHVQRRPPAVLMTWDADTDRFDDYAWGITPELADRVDRAQADLEDRRRDRAERLLAIDASTAADPTIWAEAARTILAAEPERTRAEAREPARPSPFSSGLLDGDDHVH